MDGFAVTTLNRSCINFYTQPPGGSCTALSDVLLNVLSTWIPRPRCSSESPALLRRAWLHIHACWCAYTPESRQPVVDPWVGISIGSSMSEIPRVPAGVFTGPPCLPVSGPACRVSLVADESQLWESLWRHQLAVRGALPLPLDRDQDEVEVILNMLFRKSGQQTGRQEQRMPIPPTGWVSLNVSNHSGDLECLASAFSKVHLMGEEGLTDHEQLTKSQSGSNVVTFGQGRTHNTP